MDRAEAGRVARRDAAVGVELWEKACDGNGGDVQTREAEAVEVKVTVATEAWAREKEEVESQKERPPPARLGVWLLRTDASLLL